MAKKGQIQIFMMIISLFLIISVLLLDLSSFMMSFLLILSSFLCLFETLIKIYNEIKAKEIYTSDIIIVAVVLLAFVFSYEFEAVIISFLYALFNNIYRFVYNYVKKCSILSITDINDRETVVKILNYKNSCKFLTEKILRNSAFLPLISIALISVFILISMPLIWHYNFHVSSYRALTILLLSNPDIIFISLKYIGMSAICKSAKIGEIYNCAYNLETLNHEGLIKCEDNTDLSSEYTIEYNSSIDLFTFKNMLAHVIYNSEQEFAIHIKNDLKLDVDSTLVDKFVAYHDLGIICEINQMPVYFGYPEFINALGLCNIETLDTNLLYLYIKDREIGNVSIIEPNVSETRVNINYLSSEIGKTAKVNVYIAFIVKSILVGLSLIGITKLWLILLVEFFTEIILIILTSKAFAQDLR